MKMIRTAEITFSSILLFFVAVRQHWLTLPSDPGWDIGPIPPAAAQRLKQRRGVGIAVGKGLLYVDHCLLIGLFSVKLR